MCSHIFALLHQYSTVFLSNHQDGHYHPYGRGSIRHTMHKKGLKFAHVVELAKLNFTYITVLKQPKLGLGLMIGLSTLPSRQILVVLELTHVSIVFTCQNENAFFVTKYDLNIHRYMYCVIHINLVQLTQELTTATFISSMC